MHRPGTLLACALLAAAMMGPLVPCWEIYDELYMDWDRSPLKDFRRQTRTALQRLKVQVGDKPEKILENINNEEKEIRDSKDADHDQISHVYKDLLSLAHPGTECGYDLIDRVLEITSLTIEEDDNLLPIFMPFLLKYGGKKFGDCSSSAEVMIKLKEGSTVNRRYKKWLDRFFAALVGLEEAKLSEINMLGVTKTLCLVYRDDLKIHKALKVAKELVVDTSNPFKVFDKFLLRACSGLKQGREDAFRIVSLSNAFNGSARTDDEKIQELQEYSRLCLNWTRSDMRKIAVENIKDQIRKYYGNWRCGIFQQSKMS